MADRPRLALAIPTYSRATILADILATMKEDLQRLRIPVYVSDDSPDDETRLALSSFPGLHYRRNIPALGHDGNLAATLVWPEADYIWLLGDSRCIKNGKLDKVLAFLEDQDLLFVNSHSDNYQLIPNRRGKSAHKLIRQMLWHQTMTGTTIFHQRVCAWVSSQGTNLKIKSDFPQLSIMLGFATENDPSIGWFGEPSIDSVAKPSYWHDRIVPVFVDNWTALVEAFPAIIPVRHRASIVRSHSKRVNLFNFLVLLELRLSGTFNWKRLRQPRFRDAMHLPLPVLGGILLTPRFFIVQIKRAEKSLRRLGVSRESSLRDIFDKVRKGD